MTFNRVRHPPRTPQYLQPLCLFLWLCLQPAPIRLERGVRVGKDEKDEGHGGLPTPARFWIRIRRQWETSSRMYVSIDTGPNTYPPQDQVCCGPRVHDAFLHSSLTTRRDAPGSPSPLTHSQPTRPAHQYRWPAYFLLTFSSPIPSLAERWLRQMISQVQSHRFGSLSIRISDLCRISCQGQ